MVVNFNVGGKFEGAGILEVEEGGDGADQGEDEEEGADDAVEEVEGAHVEVGTHFVDQQGYEEPPAEGADGNGEVAGKVVIVAELGQQEVEARKEADDEEENERVADGEQKAGHYVFPVGVGLGHVGFAELLGGVFAEKVDAENGNGYGAENLEQQLLRGNEVGYEGNAGAGQNAIEKVGD